MLRFTAVHYFALVLFLTAFALAQSNYTQIGLPSYTAQVPVPLGFVNTATGNLHLEIPVASIPQRSGGLLRLTLTYDSIFWNQVQSGYQPGPGGGWSTQYGTEHTGGFGWDSSTVGFCSDGWGPGDSTTNNNFRFIDLHRTSHVSQGPQTVDNECYNNNIKDSNQTPNASGNAWDGYFLNITNYTQVQAWAPDGSQVGPLSPTDTNGNLLVWNGTGNWTDELGRTPITHSTQSGCGANNPNSPAFWYIRGSDGATSTYTVNCAMYSVNAFGYSGQIVQPSSVVLPNGTQYTFNYDSATTAGHYGELKSVTLPTGGQISFSYMNGTSSPLRYVHTVSYGGGTWNLGYSGTPNSQMTTTVTGPPRYDSVVKSYVNDKTVYTTVPNGLLLLAKAQYYSGSSTLLKTVSISYTGLQPLLATTTLNDTGQVSKIQYSWPTNGNYGITQKQEWDFGSATPTRTTKISYLQDTGSIKYLSQYHIANRPISVSVYAGDGSSGSPISSTTYAYDEYSANYCTVPMLASVTGATGHDDANYGSSYWARGNVTTIKRLISGSTWTTSHQCYDTLDNVTQEVDPLGHATTYDNTEKWADTSCIPSGTLTRGYPTTITDAIGNRKKTTYYTCTGLAQAKADENDIVAGRSGTTYSYDWSNRPLSVNYPDTGQTSYSYNAVPPFLTATTLINASTSIARKTLADGYGRVSQTQLTSDPEGIDYVDTTYDALGHKASVSNPYRHTSDSTYGIITYNYDALNRVTKVTQPDNSTITTTHTGNCTTVTDEAGKARKSCSDGLGRLTGLWEDPTGLNYETDYGYDVLGDLTSVTQKGGAASTSWRTRTFAYDFLARLTSATNPESGTTSYAYDANGNVQTKTAPKPNQTGTATVTTTYSYDTLNRLTQKSYNDGLTAAVTYGYDGANLTCPIPLGFIGTGATNGRGRRTAMCDGSGNASWTFDAMGRISGENRRFFNTSGQILAQNIQYYYYLNGQPSRIFYPGGVPGYALNFNNPNGAGRITGVGDNQFNFITTATYAPHGGLATALVGPGSSYNGNKISNTYNKRLQPLTLSASTWTNTSILNLTYDFHLGTADNGNVYQITNGRNSNRTQNFSYDNLNRASQAYTTGPNWGETFTIDPWGNLTNKGPVSGKTNYENFNAAPASIKNQLSGYSYDAAGNLLSDGLGHSFTYDAENRIIATGGFTYVYDGDGKRVKKCAGNACTTTGTLYWTGVGSDTLCESDLNGNWTASYAFLNGKRIARVALPAITVNYYFSDHLGSARVITGPPGNIEKESDYYPYGGEIAISGSDPNRYKFTGKERDAESALDYFGARHYASAFGRFMQPDEPFSDQDESDPQSWNLYSYVRNNPLRNTDPTGHDCITNDGGRHWEYSGAGLTCAQVDEDSKNAQASATVTATALPSELEYYAAYATQMGNPYAHDLARFDQWANRANPIINSYLFVVPFLKFSVEEQAIADVLEAEGKEVVPLEVVQGQKNADALVNGVKTEFKTVTTAGPNTLKNQIQDGLKQAPNVVVDVRSTSITKAQAMQQIQRAEGNIGSVQGRVTILTNEGKVEH